MKFLKLEYPHKPQRIIWERIKSFKQSFEPTEVQDGLALATLEIFIAYQFDIHGTVDLNFSVRSAFLPGNPT